jgi:hypothetical protein
MITPLQGALVEKMQGGHAVLDTARSQLLLVQKLDLITTYVFGTELFWRPAEILSKLLERGDVTTDRIGRVVATLEILQQGLAKWCHRKASFPFHGD